MTMLNHTLLVLVNILQVDYDVLKTVTNYWCICLDDNVKVYIINNVPILHGKSL